MNSSLKLLAKKARNRLKSAGEYSTKVPTSTAYLTAGNYMVVANIRRIEDDPLFGKVKRILEKCETEIIFNPIAQLIDNKVIKDLSEIEKEKYILKLTKKYNEIKDYILSNNLLEKA